jgi:intracellular sulfur oxidation DsrE/DsrF family protein
MANRSGLWKQVAAISAGICLPFVLLAAPMVFKPSVSAQASLSFPQLAPVEYGAQKVIYHVNNRGSWRDRSGEAWRLVKVLNNHIRAIEPDDVTINVIFQGDGIDALQRAKSDPTLAAAFDQLRKRGVRFQVCMNTLEAYQVQVDALHGIRQGDLVQAAVAMIVHLQKQGFGYIRF